MKLENREFVTVPLLSVEDRPTLFPEESWNVRDCAEASLARTASSPCCLPDQRGLLMAPTAPAGIVSRAAAKRAKKVDGRGRPSITKIERLRSADLLRMPRGLMCKLR